MTEHHEERLASIDGVDLRRRPDSHEGDENEEMDGERYDDPDGGTPFQPPPDRATH